jgi:hypothetical protein
MNRYICYNLGDFSGMDEEFKVVEMYNIHDHGGRPFRVYISDRGRVRVFYLEYQEETYVDVEMWLVLEANPEKIWVGESPQVQMTEFSGCFGPDFKGNSILLHISENRYVFIGQFIFMFQSLFPIVEYVSPVGNNDVPYPFAVDSQDNHYLMIEKSIFKDKTGKKHKDPYQYYYYSSLITPDRGMIPTKQPIISEFQGIIEWWMGEQRWTMKYVPNPAQEYDRLMGPKFLGEDQEPKMYVKKVYQEKLVEITKEDYINLIETFGQIMGFRPQEARMIQERHW